MKYKIEDNPFSNLFFDITYKCNLKCHICFNSERMKRKQQDGTIDMPVEYFREVFERLPKVNKRHTCRLVGGEPTLHPKLNEFIEIVNEFGHNCTIGTNGVKFAEDDYIKQVETWKNPEVAAKNKIYRFGDYPFIPFFDLSGGTKNNELYQKIHNRDFLEMRLRAIDNCISIGMNTIGICAIIIRGVNEEVIPHLLEYADNHPEIPAIHFRTMSDRGTWLNNKPYTLEEIKDLLKQHIPNLDDKPKISGFEPDINKGQKCYGCCDRIIYKPSIGLNLVEFGSKRSAKCWKRGYVSDSDFTITTFFERIRNEKKFN